MMAIKTRLIYTCAAWFTAAFVYIITGFIGGNVWVISGSFVDNAISFNANGIWLYLAFYLYIPFAFFSVDASTLRLLSLAFIWTSFMSGLVFVLFPTTIVYPQITGSGLSSRVLLFISSRDTPRNCFPSLHASLIALCTFALFTQANLARRVILVLITVLMYHAIIQVRRHLFYDLAGGLVIAVVTWAVLSAVNASRKIKRNYFAD